MKKANEIKSITQINSTFATEWKRLWKTGESANYFNSYEWFSACLKIGIIREYEIIALYRDSQLHAVLPLQKAKLYGISVVSSVVNEHLVDNPILLKTYDKKILKKLLQFVFAKGNVYLQKLDQTTAQLTRNLYATPLLTILSVNPVIDTTGELFKGVSPSTIRHINKIYRLYPDKITFRFFENDTLDENILEKMVAIEQSSSKKQKAMDIFSNESTKRYFTQVPRYDKKHVKLLVLFYENEPVAYQYGYLYNKRFDGIQTAYLHEYAKVSPGKTMILKSIEILKERGVKLIDLGGGISMYKQAFTKDYKVLYDMYYSSNPLIMIWWKLINKARRLNQIIRPIKYTRDHEFLFKEL